MCLNLMDLQFYFELINQVTELSRVHYTNKYNKQTIFSLELCKKITYSNMVVGFTTTYAISAYHHWICEFESCS